jgi:hypothetical protein
MVKEGGKMKPVTRAIVGRTAAIFASALLVATGVSLPVAGTASAQQGTFADPAFRRVWERTDLAVAQARVNRAWLWGPAPGRTLLEPFREGPAGQHLVQYFDKARMEINNLVVNTADPYYVTNGLLVVEMISGRLQKGVNEFEQVGASDVQVAGDAGSDSPTYSALQNIASVGGPVPHTAAPLTPGTTIPAVFVDRFGNAAGALPPRWTGTGSMTPVHAAGYVAETGHNVADVFMEFMNSRGPVYENGAYVNGPLMNWVYTMGFPITEPFWTQISVAGSPRLVLVQAFQRRVLTYSPANPAGWKVEMANVGLQYYQWRYESPQVVCNRVPVRGFGRVWAEHRNVQQALLCPQQYPPFDKEMTIQTAWQPFEHGEMVWISRTTYIQERLIYAFFDDGTYQQFEDTWREGQPVSANLTPPAGRYEPVRGFGKVWREGTGARVRERLGWATAPEKGAPGAYQQFQRGEMYWTGAVNMIYVLFGTSGPYPGPVPTPGPGGQPFRYEVYSDTYTP